MSTLIGSTFVLLASTCSSLSTSFQKMAHRQTNYKDPRTTQQPRNKPLDTPVWCRGYFLLGMCLSIAAISCDAISLYFIGTTLIGVLGCFSIPINIIVNRILLYEEIICKETLYILIITIGCILSIITAVTHEPIETFIYFAQIESAIVLMSVWFISFILVIIVMICKTDYSQLVIYSILSGIMGAMSMTMAKYLIDLHYLISNDLILPPNLQIISAVFILLVSIPLHIISLNLALKKFNAHHAVTIFQATWCISNVSLGIIIFKDLDNISTPQAVIFMTGVLTSFVGVLCLAKQIEASPESYSDHSQP